METINSATSIRVPWNKGKLLGQKAPFKLKEIWAIRVRLQIASRCRELALFNLAVDSKLRACDLIQLRVRDVRHGQSMASRAAARVGGAGRRPAKSGQWRVEMTIQLADIWGLRYYVEKRGQEVIGVQRVMPTFGI
jgi:hypothetical protein